MQLLDPHIDLVPRLQVGDIIYNQCTLRTLVVDLVERVVSLLARCVPDVERVLLSNRKGHLLGQARRVDGTDLFLVKVALAEPKG